MANLKELRQRDLEDLLLEAWSIRQANFPLSLSCSTPSPKTFVSNHHKNKKNAFVNISVTGNQCALNCDHCKKSLLETMDSAKDGNELVEKGKQLLAKGCEGILVSGGSMATGEVPLEGFYDGIAELKNMGLKVLVHTGLASQATASKLAEAGIDQALLDIIGDQETISKVYHLNKKPDDFRNSMQHLKDAGLEVVPHILVGLNYGKISGEYQALEMVNQTGVKNIVFVMLTPKYDTPMEGITTPDAEEMARIAAIARVLNPKAHISLGCARPPGEKKLVMERLVLRAGVNGIAYPSDETVEFAKTQGLQVEFKDTCCSML